MSMRVGEDWTPERLALRYTRDGVALRALCTESGLSYGTVYKRLASVGVEFRPRGGSNRPPRASAPRVVKASDQGHE